MVVTFVLIEIYKMNRLFVIEGVDGAGKSTQIKLLRDFFSGKGYNCEYMHFPRTETPYFGELIARFLRGEFGTIDQVDPYLVAMLYAGDRKDAAAKISSWLSNDKIVLLDRYTYSNIAYQCAKINDTPGQIKLMKWILSLEFEHFAIPKPGVNIFLDVPSAFAESNLCAARTGNDRHYLNGSTDIHEGSMTFQQNVRRIYHKVAETDDRLAVIDCSNNNGEMLNPQQIFVLIINVLYERKLI